MIFHTSASNALAHKMKSTKMIVMTILIVPPPFDMSTTSRLRLSSTAISESAAAPHDDGVAQ